MTHKIGARRSPPQQLIQSYGFRFWVVSENVGIAMRQNNQVASRHQYRQLNSFRFDPSLATFADMKVRKVALRKFQGPRRGELAIAEAASFELQRVQDRGQ
jgi:hypothetical protein